MKKVLLSLFVITAVATLAVGSTRALFSDTEDVLGNTVSAGSLDLTVNGENGEITYTFNAENMAPGNSYNGGCVDLENIGTLDGLLTVKVLNPVSNDNTEIEPELSSGDVAATEVDTSGYDANDGDGELWDQIATRIYLDTGAGSHTGNGSWDWDDTSIFSNYGTPGNDASSTYNLPLDEDLAADNAVTLAATENVSLCVDVHFIDDESSWWWGIMDGMNNNMAMTDDAVFDIELGLTQVE